MDGNDFTGRRSGNDSTKYSSSSLSFPILFVKGYGSFSFGWEWIVYSSSCQLIRPEAISPADSFGIRFFPLYLHLLECVRKGEICRFVRYSLVGSNNKTWRVFMRNNLLKDSMLSYGDVKLYVFDDFRLSLSVYLGLCVINNKYQM